MAQIVIIEDDERSRRLLTDVLGFHGYTHAAFENGEAGLAAIRQSPPSLLLLDIQLPGMSGFDVLRAIRSDPAIAGLPVVAVTASVMDTDRKRIIDSGFDAYVPKPVNLLELLEVVRRYTNR